MAFTNDQEAAAFLALAGRTSFGEAAERLAATPNVQGRVAHWPRYRFARGIAPDAIAASPDLERKLFTMKGFHHPGGSQQAFLTGLAHLYNLVPYQRRAQHAGQCGVQVEGGTVPTRDWFLNLQILTSGGFR